MNLYLKKTTTNDGLGLFGVHALNTQYEKVRITFKPFKNFFLIKSDDGNKAQYICQQKSTLLVSGEFNAS